jgi:hypothetical protein
METFDSAGFTLAENVNTTMAVAPDPLASPMRCARFFRLPGDLHSTTLVSV